MSDINFLQWVINQLWNDLTSTDYLSQLIKQKGYDPYTFNWDLPNVPVANYQTSAQAICTNTHPLQSPPWTFSGPPNINISGSTITGLSNVTVSNPPPTVQPDNTGTYDGIITITLDFNNLAVTNGPFTLTQQCCQPPVGVYQCSTSDPSDTQVGTGTYDLSIPQATGVCKFGVNVQPVLVDAQSVSLTVENTSGMSITVNITSIPPKSDPALWNCYAEEALDTSTAYSALIQEISNTMNGSSELQQLGSILTETIQGWMNSGSYPFQPAATGAF